VSCAHLGGPRGMGFQGPPPGMMGPPMGMLGGPGGPGDEQRGPGEGGEPYETDEPVRRDSADADDRNGRDRDRDRDRRNDRCVVPWCAAVVRCGGRADGTVQGWRQRSAARTRPPVRPRTPPLVTVRRAQTPSHTHGAPSHSPLRMVGGSGLADPGRQTAGHATATHRASGPAHARVRGKCVCVYGGEVCAWARVSPTWR
jgi:hypothetical protein